MYKLLAYPLFWLRSIKLHGVHSPFVFDFEHQALRKTYPLTPKTSFNCTQKERLLFNSLQYFNVETIIYVGKQKESTFKLLKKTSAKNIILAADNPSLKDFIIQQKVHKSICIYLESLQSLSTLNQITAIEERLFSDNVMVVINDLYQSKKRHQQWKKWSRTSFFQVSIDTYHLGILIRKKDQAKEYFTIKV